MIEISDSLLHSACMKHLTGLEKKVRDRINHSSKFRTPRYLIDFLLKNLTTILVGKPIKLIEINSRYYSGLKGKKKKRYNKFLRSVFNYGNFTSKKIKDYDAYDLASNLDIKVCPYCNRQYTITVKTGIKKSEHITRPQFDHFFSKEKYPLLGLSFYNLIPSCVLCNSTFKHTKEFNLKDFIHPYIDSCIHDYRFSYTPKSTSGGLGHSPSADIKINYHTSDPALQMKLSNTFEVFKITEVYNGHIDEVQEIIKLKRVMNGNYLDILRKHTYSGLKIPIEEIYRLAFGVYFEEEYFYKRPISKLKKDILKELGII